MRLMSPRDKNCIRTNARNVQSDTLHCTKRNIALFKVKHTATFLGFHCGIGKQELVDETGVTQGQELHSYSSLQRLLHSETLH